MTRINANLSVENLTDEHLLAEHREIKRVCNRFSKRLQLNKFNDIPLNFTLGSGHELFFTIRPEFTNKRYISLHNECLKRKFNVQDFSDNWKIYKSINPNILKQYNPTLSDKISIIKRISERILSSPKQYFHYYGKPITKQDAINLLNI